MDKKQIIELQKLYQRYKAGHYLTQEERQLLRRFLNLSTNEKHEFAEQVNESVDDIETFIEKDIKRN